MGDYKNWDSVIEGFEDSEGWKGSRTDKNYYVSLVGWLRRNHTPPSRRVEKIRIGDLTIHLNSRLVTFDSGGHLLLSKKVFNLLVLLASNPDRVFSRLEILDAIWDKGVVVLEKTVDVHVNRIRKVLGNDIILTHMGYGYRINTEAESLRKNENVKYRINRIRDAEQQ